MLQTGYVSMHGATCVTLLVAMSPHRCGVAADFARPERHEKPVVVEPSRPGQHPRVSLRPELPAACLSMLLVNVLLGGEKVRLFAPGDRCAIPSAAASLVRSVFTAALGLAEQPLAPITHGGGRGEVAV